VLQRARSYASEAAAIAMKLSESDPDSMEFLFARTAQRLRAARIDLHRGEPVEFFPLRSAAETLLGVDEPPSSWRVLALSVAEIGVRLGASGAAQWARMLLETQRTTEAGQGAAVPKYLELMVSLAQHDPAELARLRNELPAIVELYREDGDFELARPLFRAFELLGDASRSAEMRRVLREAGSRHPDFVSGITASSDAE
jgi:hypothetical protein